MRHSYLFILVIFFLAVGCSPKLDETLISNVPASTKQIGLARQAASICEAQLPSFANTVSAFTSNGFYETQESILSDSGPEFRRRTFGAPGSGIEVNVSVADVSNVVKDAEGLLCTIALPGMTPNQSFELAQIWVEAYEGKTNEEVGDGLSPLAVQAWRSSNDDRRVFFSAHKTWPPLGRPGAAIRLFYYPR